MPAAPLLAVAALLASAAISDIRRMWIPDR